MAARAYVGASALVALAALIWILVVFTIWAGGAKPHDRRGTTADQQDYVLPLANSGDPELEYLADGISESLIGSLSQLPSLKVIAQTSSFGTEAKRLTLNKWPRLSEWMRSLWAALRNKTRTF